MANIKEYERKKRKAFIWHVGLSIFWLGSFLLLPRSSGKDSSTSVLISCSVVSLLWICSYVEYRNASTKLEIFKELEDKKR